MTESLPIEQQSQLLYTNILNELVRIVSTSPVIEPSFTPNSPKAYGWGVQSTELVGGEPTKRLFIYDESGYEYARDLSEQSRIVPPYAELVLPSESSESGLPMHLLYFMHRDKTIQRYAEVAVIDEKDDSILDFEKVSETPDLNLRQRRDLYQAVAAVSIID